MSKSKEQDPSTDEVQREIRAQQKFNVASAIGRAGSGLMKGESPVSQQEQAIILLTQWIDQQTSDPSGALKSILRRQVRCNQLLVARPLQQPLNALREMIDTILASDYALREFVRQVDVRWGEMYYERPLFQRAGQEPNPTDLYTHESVRQDLCLLLEKLQDGV
ncbi:MAG: hypothetical protein J7K09_05540 [Desulfuromusa sp.]|nr:hypothetical protein [Desulfuromusa sp.]